MYHALDFVSASIETTMLLVIFVEVANLAAFEEAVTLYRKSERWKLDGFEFGQANSSILATAHTQVAQSPHDVVVGFYPSDEPS